MTKSAKAATYDLPELNLETTFGGIGTTKQRDVPRILDQGGQVNNVLVRVKETRSPQQLGVSANEARKRKFRFVRASFRLQPRPYVSPQSVNYPKIIEFFRKNLEQLPL